MSLKFTFVQCFDPGNPPPDDIKIKIAKERAARELAERLIRDATVELSRDGTTRVVIEV